MQPTLYNARTKKIEPVTPLDNKTLRIYTCGPTVYDHAHIGNLASFIFADTLRRALHTSFTGKYNVLHAMNSTDVDDKTIKRSQQEYPDDTPEHALHQLTRTFEQLFMADMQKVGNDTSALKFMRATESIPLMQTLITKLYQQGIAYIADDGVYFSISNHKKTRTYGQLTKITASNTSTARINNDEYDKASVHDFALWKAHKPSEPSWEFELDGHQLTGRPGWHIECSAMSTHALGQPFDIHTGGIDLQFPHHENEIAQSTAGDQPETYANFFCYNEHVLVDGKKMSKSLGNFYTLVDVIERGFDPMAFRLLVLQSHYRSQLNFSWESLKSAQQRLRDLQAFADLRFQTLDDKQAGSIQANALNVTLQQIIEALSTDLATPKALAVLNSLLSDAFEGVAETQAIAFEDFLKHIDAVFGLQLLASTDIIDEQKQIIRQRQTAREAKNWTESDMLRDTLQRQGIGIRDTQNGPIWFRI